MAIDATTSFNPAFSTLAMRAYRLLGALPSNEVGGGAMSNDQATQALLAANLMLKSWQIQGVNLFRRAQMSLVLTAGMGTPTIPFVFPTNVITVMDARWVVNPAPNLYERPMSIWPYLRYMQLPNKYSGASSGPSVFMFDRQTQGSNAFVFPPPLNGGMINATVGRIAADIDFITSNVDLPQEWLETFVYNLADRLMDDDAIADAAGAAQTAERVTTRARKLYGEVLDFDRPDSIFIQSYSSGRSGGRGRR